jgi:cellulose biosynthesis protein BcsQ
VGAFQAILTGTDGKHQRPVADLLVVPTSPELMDLRPVIRVVRGEVAPLGLVHLLVLTRVDPVAMGRAHDRQAELRSDYRLAVADVIVRDYVVYREAVERSRTVLDVGGAKSYARRAEEDYRALTAEVLAVVGIGDLQHQEA